MFYIWPTDTWLEKRNNYINDPSSLNPGGICDSGLSLNIYLQAHPGDTGKCPSKLTAYISVVRLNIQRCITYTYVHVWGYLFSTIVCYGYVCLVCVYMQFCVLMSIPSCIDLWACHLFVSHVLIFFLYVYLFNKWFQISDNQFHPLSFRVASMVPDIARRTWQLLSDDGARQQHPA